LVIIHSRILTATTLLMEKITFYWVIPADDYGEWAMRFTYRFTLDIMSMDIRSCYPQYLVAKDIRNL
jgi:hypothetical protein